MAAISNHYGDVANWIETVIDSCEHPLQEKAARKLVRLFERNYFDKLDNSTFIELSRRLNRRLDDKIYGRLEKQLNKTV